MKRSGGLEIAYFLLILGGLVAFLIPAIQKTRDASARTQTNNNLKQCALSVHTFHDNFNKLPNAYSTGGQYEMEASFWVHILPFVECSPNYSSRRVDVSIAPYLSPADPTSDTAGLVNFAANLRLFGYKSFLESDQSINEAGAPLVVPAGTMLCGLKLQSIKRGTTNTIMLTTRYGNCAGVKTYFAADAHGNCSYAVLPTPGAGGFMGAGSTSTPPMKGGPLTAMYQLAPSVAECLPDAGVFGHSFTTGGLSVALCDSAIRNIAPTMSPTTFANALCPMSNAPLGDDCECER